MSTKKTTTIYAPTTKSRTSGANSIIGKGLYKASMPQHLMSNMVKKNPTKSSGRRK